MSRRALKRGAIAGVILASSVAAAPVVFADGSGGGPTNPAEAIGQNGKPARAGPVYLSDGVTQIGVFEIEASDP